MSSRFLVIDSPWTKRNTLSNAFFLNIYIYINYIYILYMKYILYILYICNEIKFCKIYKLLHDEFYQYAELSEPLSPTMWLQIKVKKEFQDLQ